MFFKQNVRKKYIFYSFCVFLNKLVYWESVAVWASCDSGGFMYILLVKYPKW
jgi:hypothetical protein